MESSTLNAAVNITVLAAPSMRSAYHFSIFESLRGEKMHVIDFFLVAPTGVGVRLMHDVFASAGCGSCHTLADAGTSGTVGPNLDESQPSPEAAYEQILNGGGGMPPYEGQLDEQQIADVTAYVVEATSG